MDGNERSTTHVFRSLKNTERVYKVRGAACGCAKRAEVLAARPCSPLPRTRAARIALTLQLCPFFARSSRFQNATALKVQEAEAAAPGDFSAIRPYVSGSMYADSFQKTGDTQSSVWSAGVVMGLIDDVPTCKELLERMVREAEEVIGGLGKYTSKL